MPIPRNEIRTLGKVIQPRFENRVSGTTSDTWGGNDFLVGFGSSSVNTCELPIAADWPGRVVCCKKLNDGINNNGSITVTRQGADTIDGATTFLIKGLDQTFHFISDGTTQWKILESYNGIDAQLFDWNAVGGTDGQRILRPVIDNITGNFANINATAYFIYIGKTLRAITPKYIALRVNTAGVGAQTGELGFFSTPLPPNKAAQSLTKLISTAAIADLTTTGIKRNTAAFATLIPAGTNLWAGIRVAMVTTEPQFYSVGRGQGQGLILEQAAAALFSTAGPWAGVIPADNQAEGPHLSGELD